MNKKDSGIGMTLKEIKDKYFPNRSLEELKGLREEDFVSIRDAFNSIPTYYQQKEKKINSSKKDASSKKDNSFHTVVHPDVKNVLYPK